MPESTEVKKASRTRLSSSVRQAVRTKRVVIHSVRELGALLRIARQRLNMSQTDAAICCGVGRRFYVELENGKPSVRMDKVFMVLNALGLNLALGGPGTAFTIEQLANACLKQEEDEPEHVWEAEFVKGLSAPYEVTPPPEKPVRGRRAGSVELRYRRKNAVHSEDGNTNYTPAVAEEADTKKG